MEPTTTYGLLNQQEYDQYAADWLTLLSSGNDHALREAFRSASVERISFVSFSMEQLLSLVSTLGVRRVRARFLLMPDADDQPRFTLALYATDASTNRLSAYYAATATASAATSPQALQQATPPVRLAGLVPTDLASRWLLDWADAGPLTSDMFATSYGALQGYDFELSDFMDPLFAAQPLADKQLLLSFGLHTFYPPYLTATPPPPTQTFGLLAYIGAVPAGSSFRAIPANALFYDLSHPCPPNN